MSPDSDTLRSAAAEAAAAPLDLLLTDAASAAADLIVSLSGLMILLLQEPRQQGAFFHWSLVTNPGSAMVLRAQALA